MENGHIGSDMPQGDTYQTPPAQGYRSQAHAQQPLPQQSYPPPSGYVQPPYPSPGAMPSDGGLSDTAAGTLAYITVIPAIIFLIVAPYNTRPFVKFHAFQCLGLFVTGFCLGLIAIIPLLGLLVWILGSLTLLVVWIVSIVKASQGSYLRLPVISAFASQQSGYPLR